MRRGAATLALLAVTALAGAARAQPRCADAASCAAAAESARRGRDLATARAHVEQGCALGSVALCAELGRMLSRGAGGPADPARAAELLAEACDRGVAEGCLGLARLAPDGAAEEAAHRRGCALGHAPSCVALAGVHARRGEHGEGAVLLAQACGLGDAAACTHAPAFARAAESAEVPADPGAERERCASGDRTACRARATRLLIGAGVPRDLPEAVALLREDCRRLGRGGSAASCFRLGALYERGEGLPRQVPRALALYAVACEAGHGEACTRQARPWLPPITGPGPGVEGVLLQALMIDQGLEAAPDQSWRTEREGPEPSEAELDGWLARGCELGDAVGCRLAAGRSEDEAVRRGRYERGCALGDATSCAELAGLVPGDERRALRALACRSGAPTCDPDDAR